MIVAIHRHHSPLNTSLSEVWHVPNIYKLLK